MGTTHLFLRLRAPPLQASIICPYLSLCTHAVRSTNDVGQVQEGNSTPVPPHLDRSAPPAFIEKNNLSLDGGFIVSKEGEPTAEELANENVIKVVAEKCTDEELNWLLWKCLGEKMGLRKDCRMIDVELEGVIGKRLPIIVGAATCLSHRK